MRSFISFLKRFALICAALLLASQAYAQEVACSGGVRLPVGALFPSEPAGCRGLPGFVEFENNTKACMTPRIADLDSSMVTLTAQGAQGPIGIGVRTDLGDRFCIQPGGKAYGFVPDSESVAIGATFWSVPSRMSWEDAPFLNEGVPMHLLNAVSVDQGFRLVPSRVVGTCRSVSRNLTQPSARRDVESGIPEITYDYTNASCQW